MVNNKERMRFKGKVSIIDMANGKEIASFDNMIMDAGRAWVMDLLRGNISGEYWEFIAVGDGNTSVTPADTTLDSELARESTTSTLPAPNQVILEAIFGTGVATGTWQEVGIFTASSGGVMFNRAVYDPVTKAADQALMVRWTIVLI